MATHLTKITESFPSTVIGSGEGFISHVYKTVCLCFVGFFPLYTVTTLK